jgi:uncharacterized protein (TIGR02145 family)
MTKFTLQNRSTIMKTKRFLLEAAIFIALALILSGCGDSGGGTDSESPSLLGAEFDEGAFSSGEAASSSSRAVAASSSSGKAAGADVSGKPVATAKTENSITVGALTTAAGQAVEYAISESATVPSHPGYWQSERSFEDLEASTAYYVFARSAENANYSAGTAQMSEPITTLTPPKNPVTCGDRAEEPFDPDLYECRDGGKIYLKEKPKDAGGREYEAVLIGTQTWMAENMKYAAEGSICYNAEGSVSNYDGCEIYGRLYNLETAMGVCPEGWHLPTRDEWNLMVDVIGDRDYGSALKLKDVGWKNNHTSTDDYGFKALPSAIFTSSFFSPDVAFWWTSTPKSDNTYWVTASINNSTSVTYISIGEIKGLLDRALPTSYLGVRCVMDNL